MDFNKLDSFEYNWIMIDRAPVLPELMTSVSDETLCHLSVKVLRFFFLILFCILLTKYCMNLQNKCVYARGVFTVGLSLDAVNCRIQCNLNENDKKNSEKYILPFKIWIISERFSHILQSSSIT